MFVRIPSSAPLVALLFGAAVTALVLGLQPRQDPPATAQAGQDATPAPRYATTTASAPTLRGESRVGAGETAEAPTRNDANVVALEQRSRPSR